MRKRQDKTMKPSLDSNVGANHAGQINPFLVSVQERVSRLFKPRLFGQFVDSEDFLYTLEVLELATEDDQVELHISGPGGSASAISTLTHAMKKCEAPIHVVMTGEVASAATMPMFFADSIEIANDATFLFHAAIYGTSPDNMQSTKDCADFHYESCARLIRSTYKNFFTEEEIEQLIKNQKQWWMFGDEVMERFRRKVEIEQEQANKEEENVERTFTEEEETPAYPTIQEQEVKPEDIAPQLWNAYKDVLNDEALEELRSVILDVYSHDIIGFEGGACLDEAFNWYATNQGEGFWTDVAAGEYDK